MTTTDKADATVRNRRTEHLSAWGLIVGGALYFSGGGMHPGEDPPDVTVKEHLRLMYEDPAWYPAHTVFLGGMVLLAAALVGLARSGRLRPVPAAQKALVAAAVSSTVAAVGSLLHLVAGSEAEEIAAGQSTPITDVHVIAETITVPLFGLSIVALAVVGAATRTLGNWPAAALGAVGGMAYALAAGTFLFTDALNFLFPVSSGIALWAVIAGVGLLWHRRTVLEEPTG